MYDNSDKKEDYWDLGKPRERKYAKPDFSGHTIDTTDIVDDGASVLSPGEARAEKIMPRTGAVAEKGRIEGGAGAPSSFIDPIGGKRIITSSYRRHSSGKRSVAIKNTAAPRRIPGEIIASVDADGMLIKKIEVRRWETDTEFYGRFTSDASVSHRSKPIHSVDSAMDPVPFFSYVPQYAHMNSAQVEYYRWVRENIRNGRTPECDLPYLQLYIYEILNLPDEILPDDGAQLLARIWLGYRKKYPRLDGYLCEWMTDYCMINGVPLPKELLPILSEITPKAQFKEFFIDSAIKGGADIGGIVAEAVSDYDYKNSRYYEDNGELFDRHITAALSHAVAESVKQNKSVFSLDRTYKMVRDSYCGAIVASNIKRRVDIEFCSFTRRADARQIVTAMVKYAENKVRAIAGVKPKLGTEKLNADIASIIDGYFDPFLPKKARPAEDRYMPNDYLKNYEAEDSGFDIDRATLIEKQSWANTERLTGEGFSEENFDEPAAYVNGEISYDAINTTDVEKEMPIEKAPSEEIAQGAQGKNGDSAVKDAIRAALEGEFGSYCRSLGAFEGDIADRVNTRMLDVIGDIALESDGDGYSLIEDYREDIEQWLWQTQ